MPLSFGLGPHHFVLRAQLAPGEKWLVCIPGKDSIDATVWFEQQILNKLCLKGCKEALPVNKTPFPKSIGHLSSNPLIVQLSDLEHSQTQLSLTSLERNSSIRNAFIYCMIVLLI